MRGGLRQDGGNVVGRDIVPSAHERLRLGGPHDGNAGARAQALQKPAARTRGGQQILQVVQQRFGGMHLLHKVLQLQQFMRCQHGRQHVQHFAPVSAPQQFALSGAVGVTERNPHVKAIQLRLGQGVSAKLVVRVLRGDDKKGLRQRSRLAFNRDLLFFHGFEQRALRLGTGAVDFVSQQHLGKHRPRMKHKALFLALVD